MTDSKPKIDDFRLEVSTWLEENFPKSLNGKASELSLGKNVSGKLVEDSGTWRKNLAAAGGRCWESLRVPLRVRLPV